MSFVCVSCGEFVRAYDRRDCLCNECGGPGKQHVDDAFPALQRAVNLLTQHVAGGACAFAQARPHAGETCAEWRTKMQGAPCAGCMHCETVKFLCELGLPVSKR